MTRTILLTGLVSAMAVATASAQKDVAQAGLAGRQARLASLQGLAGVFVEINPIETSSDDADILAKLLRGDVEARLRSAGIPILTRKEGFYYPGNPHLSLSVSVVKPNASMRVFGVHLALVQEVILDRNATRNYRATTWAVGLTGYAPGPGFSPMRKSVQELTNRFCTDYLEVNHMNQKAFTIPYEGPLATCALWKKPEEFIENLTWDYRRMMANFPRREVLAAAKRSCKGRVTSREDFAKCLACVREIVQQLDQEPRTRR